MTDYISLKRAIVIADYAIGEHPYVKDRKRPETYSDYNQGWTDACFYIHERLEAEKPNVEKHVRRGIWIPQLESEITGFNPEFAGRDPVGEYICSKCKHEAVFDCNGQFVLSDWCPFCGAKMDLESEE